MQSSFNASDSTNAIGKPNLLVALYVLTLINAVLVLVQAAFAGQGWFKGDPDFINLHELLANVFFLTVFAQIALTWIVRIPGAIGRRLLLMGVLLLVLTIAQIGLGYAGRESAQAAAWHIPNGVLMFGVAGATSSLVGRVRERV